jgi:signal transduction histidine kinase
MRIRKKTVLGTGFGIVIGLLILSTALAYQIQESFSQRSLEIHRRYVQQQELLTNLRRVLWMAGITARDYFLNPAANSVEMYRAQIAELRTEERALFDQLGKSSVPEAERKELVTRFEDLWDALNSSSTDGWDEAQRYSFVQEEIVPRRNAAGTILSRLEDANHRFLTDSEHEYNKTRRAAAQRLVMMLGAGLLIGLAVTRFTLRYADNLERQSARRLKEVSQAKQELERLSARLMEIQEQERTRISRELHDEIVQNLALLKMDITQAQPMALHRLPEISENLARARDLADRTMKTLRNIMLLLRPSLLDDLGLGPALQWLTEDFTRRTRVPCTLDESGLNEDLPDALKTCVYRVTQEALHNCEKHAQASRVTVRVLRASDNRTVEIEDDGVGFRGIAQQGTEPSLHFGVLGMRERAAALGGSLTVESAPGRGAVVRLVVPVPQRSDAETREVEITA